MSSHDSMKSADKKARINLHDFFVPVIVMVVVCILVVATFHDKEAGNQLAGGADKKQAGLVADTMAVMAIHNKALEVADAPLKTMHTTTISEQSIHRDQGVTTRASDSADTADTGLMSPARNSLTAGIDESVTKPATNTTSTEKPTADQKATDRDPANNESERQAAVADRRQATLPMQDQWRRVYQDTRQAQQAHRMKMLEYRAEVMKRIEQDRRDLYNLYRHRHNSAQQSRQHRDRYRDRPEQASNGA